MSFPPAPSSPYLVTQRAFPQNAPELEPVLVKMYNDIASAMNVRTIGLHYPFQLVTGEQWFNPDSTAAQGFQPRQTYRQVYFIGAIASGATSNTPHNIVAPTAFTDIYGTCVTDFPDYRPIPYSSVAGGGNIELRVDATNIIIVNGAASPNILSAIVVLEYLLN